ncbi:MAG: Hsp70 family protein, partial [Firmicutes bacterium]|nr:Hsp70 family protein [Bacillota bacterium]
PAPRGIPQIEVRFDIDANGIVHVSAKDLGTGKQQSITITSSSGLSDEEIDRMMADAERYKEEDEKRKRAVEIRNQGDAMVYQTERTLKDLEDKITEEEKAAIIAAKDALAETLKGDDTDAIEEKTKELSEAIYKATERIYKEAGAPCENCDSCGNDDGTVDADFHDVN